MEVVWTLNPLKQTSRRRTQQLSPSLCFFPHLSLWRALLLQFREEMMGERHYLSILDCFRSMHPHNPAIKWRRGEMKIFERKRNLWWRKWSLLWKKPSLPFSVQVNVHYGRGFSSIRPSLSSLLRNKTSKGWCNLCTYCLIFSLIFFVSLAYPLLLYHILLHLSFFEWHCTWNLSFSLPPTRWVKRYPGEQRKVKVNVPCHPLVKRGDESVCFFLILTLDYSFLRSPSFCVIESSLSWVEYYNHHPT